MFMTHQQTSTALLTFFMCPITRANRSTWSGGGQEPCGVCHHPRCTSPHPCHNNIERTETVWLKNASGEKSTSETRDAKERSFDRWCGAMEERERERERERRNWIQFFPLNPSLGPPLSATAFYISRTQDEAQEVERKKEKAVDVQLSRAASQGKSIEFN